MSNSTPRQPIVTQRNRRLHTELGGAKNYICPSPILRSGFDTSETSYGFLIPTSPSFYLGVTDSYKN